MKYIHQFINFIFYPIIWIYGKWRPYNRVSTPVILQQSATECGIITLAILFSYYKVHEKLETLREKCGISRDGCRATILIEIAKEYGFEAKAYCVENNDLFQLTEPVIAYWGFNHYVVINGVGTNKVFINDPASGTKAISLDEFDQWFTGVIIFLAPSKKTIEKKIQYSFSVSSFKWILNFKNELILSFIFSLLFTISILFYSAISNVFVELLISTECKKSYVICLILTFL